MAALVAAAPAEPGASATPRQSWIEELGDLLNAANLKADLDMLRDSRIGCGPACAAWTAANMGRVWLLPKDADLCRAHSGARIAVTLALRDATPPAPLPSAQPAEPREVLCPSFVALGEYATACGREMPKPTGSKVPVFCCGHSEEAHPVYARPSEPYACSFCEVTEGNGVNVNECAACNRLCCTAHSEDGPAFSVICEECAPDGPPIEQSEQLGKEGVGAAPAARPIWRVGGKVPINVYEGDRPIAQFHDAETAALVVRAVNAFRGAAAVPEAGARDFHELHDLTDEELADVERLGAKVLGHPDTLPSLVAEVKRRRALSSPSGDAARKRDWTGPRRRKDGWPLCPFCGKDEPIPDQTKGDK